MALDGIIVVELEVSVPGLVIPDTTLAWLGRQIQVTWRNLKNENEKQHETRRREKK